MNRKMGVRPSCGTCVGLVVPRSFRPTAVTCGFAFDGVVASGLDGGINPKPGRKLPEMNRKMGVRPSCGTCVGLVVHEPWFSAPNWGAGPYWVQGWRGVAGA